MPRRAGPHRRRGPRRRGGRDWPRCSIRGARAARITTSTPTNVRPLRSHPSTGSCGFTLGAMRARIAAERSGTASACRTRVAWMQVGQAPLVGAAAHTAGQVAVDEVQVDARILVVEQGRQRFTALFASHGPSVVPAGPRVPALMAPDPTSRRDAPDSPAWNRPGSTPSRGWPWARLEVTARALDGFVRATQADVWRCCAHLVAPDAADDLTQETYLRLVTALRSFRGDASGRTFVLADRAASLRRRDPTPDTAACAHGSVVASPAARHWRTPAPRVRWKRSSISWSPIAGRPSCSPSSSGCHTKRPRWCVIARSAPSAHGCRGRVRS